MAGWTGGEEKARLELLGVELLASIVACAVNKIESGQVCDKRGFEINSDRYQSNITVSSSGNVK